MNRDRLNRPLFFFRDCVRVRLPAGGNLRICLYATQGHSLREFLDNRPPVEWIAERIREVKDSRDDHSSGRHASQSKLRDEKVEISYIGG